MPRRGENIRKRKDGRWEGRFKNGTKSNGKIQYKSIYGKSYSDVKARLKNEIIKQTEEPTISVITLPLKEPVTSMKVICFEWLKAIEITLKEPSYAIYYTKLEKHIIPYFKNVSADIVSNELLQGFVFALIEKKLEAKTIQDIFSVLIQIIEYGQHKHYIPIFTINVKLPKKTKTELSIFTKTEQTKLIKYLLQNLTLESIGILLALSTGIRIGELCALRWSDIDLEEGNIKINFTIQRIKNTNEYATTKTKIVINRPKSDNSIRIIPLSNFLLEILKKQKVKYPYANYVLTGKEKPIEPRRYQATYKNILKSANVTYSKFHTLRHTFATRGIEAGVDPKTLSELLGHSSVKFTLEYYVHSSVELKKNCVEKIINY